ncbi:MAG: aldo/keto reductase, partial [Cyanobacteria bacterium P01_E01_bin.48]
MTLTALECGYRNFFASVLAGNQRGFAKAVKQSGIDRKDIFVCGSVLSNRAQGYEAALRSTRRGCDENLEALGDGLDMIMLDYPGPDRDSVRGQWAGLE